MVAKAPGPSDRTPPPAVTALPVPRRAVTVLVGLAILVLLVSLGIVQVLLLVFAGVLLATLIRLVARLIAHYTHLSRGWSVFAAVALLVALLAGGAWIAAPPLAQQFEDLAVRIPQAVDQANKQLQTTNWGRTLLGFIPNGNEISGERLLSRVTGVVSTTLGVASSIIVVLFVGLFIAADPKLYSTGIVLLFPPARQPRIRQVLAALDHTLRHWIAGQAITMVVIGTITGVGLWIIGVPLALLLGVLAALLNFIPTFGPLIAFIPAALLALAQGPTALLWVGGLWIVAQSLEGYVLTPLIQRKAVQLPPVLTIVAQIIFATLFGAIGIVVAAPLTAVLLVIVKMLYVEDVLGNQVEVAGEDKARQ